MDVKRLVAAAISLALVLSAGLSKAAAPDVQVQPLELQPANPLQLNYSPNGLHCAFIAPLGSRSTVSFDGNAQGKFDDIQGFGQSARSFLFSAEGPHLAFGARRGQDMFVVVDGVEQPVGTYLTCVTESIFSPDGNQFAFSVNPQGKAGYIMLNGKPQGQYVGVHSLLFSSNSKHFAYLTNQNRDVSSSDAAGKTVSTRKSFVVYDGQPGPDQVDTKDLMFSPDGDHYAYIGRMMDKNQTPGTAASYHEHLYIDGKDSVTADTIDRMVFSADGKHLACMILIKKPGQNADVSYPLMDKFIWFDGQKLAFNNQGSHGDPPQISTDGTAVAYVEDATPDTSSNGMVVAVNGKPGDEYHDITDMHFFGDHQLIYRASQINTGQAKQTYFIVQDGNEAGPYTMTPNAGQAGNFGILISPDGKHVAYPAQDGTTISVMLDGKPGPKLERIDRKPIFSPDSQHLAVIAYQDPAKNMAPIQRQQYEHDHPGAIGETLVLHGQMTPLGANTSCDLVFSPDSKHWAIVAGGAGGAGGGMTHLLVDGRPIFLPKNAAAPGTPQFTADSAHLVDTCGTSDQSNYGGYALIIDGTPLAGYGITSAAGLASPIGNPLQMLPDGSIHAFAVKGDDKSFVALTIKPAPADKFGSSDPGKQNTAPNTSTVAANNANSNQQQNQQQSSSPQQQADNAENQVNQANNNVQNANNAAQNAKNAGSAIGNLFKHHH